jgi:hypothetical protein
MQWNPNNFGRTQAPAQQQAQQAPQAPAPQQPAQQAPAWGGQQHPTAAPQPAPGWGGQQPAQQPQQPAFGAPQAPQGFGAPQPPQGGYRGPQGAAPVGFPGGFRPSPVELGGPKMPDVPFGMHVLVCQGREFVGRKQDLMLVNCVVEQSDSVQPGTICAIKRPLRVNHNASDEIVTKAIGELAVPLSGRQKEDADAMAVCNLVAEFVQNSTLDGRPIAGMRVGVTSQPGNRRDQDGNPYPELFFHALPPQ